MSAAVAWARRHGMLLLRVAVSLGFLAVLVVAVSRSADLGAVRFHGIHWIVLGVLPAVASVLVKGTKWFVVARPFGRVGFLECVRSYMAAIPYSLVTPGRVGEAGRVLYMRDPRLRGATGVGLVFLDKFIDLVALLWWIVAGLFLSGEFRVWGLALLPVAAAATAVRFWVRVAYAVIRRMPALRGFRDKAAAAARDAATLDARSIAAALALGLVSFGVEWVQYWAFFNALAAPGVHVAFASTVIIMALITLANVAQISVAGIGVRESLAALLLASRLAPASAALAAFLVFFLDQGLPGIAGLSFRTRTAAEELT